MGEPEGLSGTDRFGRTVCQLLVPDLDALGEVQARAMPFVLFLGADTSELSPEALYGAAVGMLEKGAVYVVCWGPGCERAEEIFDEAAVGPKGLCSYGHIMTTSHSGETIEDALHFATTAAVPDQAFRESCTTVLVVFVGNVNWYNEGHNCLEDLLGDQRGS